MNREDNIKRIQSLSGIIIGRWFLLLGLVLLGVMQYVLQIVIVSSSVDLWVLFIAVMIAYNFGYTIWIRQPVERLNGPSLWMLSFLQVFVDQVFVTAIIYITGGIESVSYILYFFPVMSATILYADMAITFFSILNVLLYSSIVLLEFQGAIHPFTRYNQPFFDNPDAILANTVTIDLILLFIGMFSVFINRIIRDREAQITVERDKVNTILQSLEDGLLLIDAAGQVLLINPPAADLLQISQQTMPATLTLQHYPAAMHPLVRLLAQEPASKKIGQPVVIDRSDDKLYLQVDSIPLRQIDGRVLSWIAVLHDMTREKELDEVKSDFISIAAHQLRTPLAALKWFFKIMVDGDAGPVNAQQADLLQKAYQRNNEVIEIVNNLLNISEIEEGRFPYEFRREDCTPLVSDIVNMAQADAEQKNVELHLHAPADGTLLVQLDKPKLRMAIQNLIDNAIKYSAQGGVVDVTMSVQAGQCLIAVADHGIGIPKEEREKIFSKFFRGRLAKEHEMTGSGLGLYIVRNIVKKHRGRLTFDSIVGQGTTFYISLPLAVV